MADTGKLKWTRHDDVVANAKRELPRLAAGFFAAVRKTLAEPRTARKLHSIRLASKKLRYTLELFRPLYPAGLDERLNELKKLQDWLGAANDAAASLELLGRATLREHPELREFLERRAAAQADGFTRYWKRTFDAKGQEAWWTDFLGQEARAPL